MTLWQYYKQRVKEAEKNKSIKWSTMRYSMRSIYYDMWEKSYYAKKLKEHAERRQKFLDNV